MDRTTYIKIFTFDQVAVEVLLELTEVLNNNNLEIYNFDFVWYIKLILIEGYKFVLIWGTFLNLNNDPVQGQILTAFYPLKEGNF